MPLSKNLRRERSIAITVGTTTFNAPGIYYPPYGKSVFELSGRGSPGNATVPSTVIGSNSNTYYYYVPAVPSFQNQYWDGFTYNPGYAGGVLYEFRLDFYGPGYTFFATNQFAASDPGPVGGEYGINFYAYGYSYYEPASPPAPAYNPGNFNAYEPAYTASATNPGNPNYNPTVAGTAGTNYTVLGVPLPGGAADTAAPVIGYSAVQVSYVNAGVPISVPPGGYVVIRNKLPNT